jgi:hypothetical protein
MRAAEKELRDGEGGGLGNPEHLLSKIQASGVGPGGKRRVPLCREARRRTIPSVGFPVYVLVVGMFRIANWTRDRGHFHLPGLGKLHLDAAPQEALLAMGSENELLYISPDTSQRTV